MKNIPLVSVVMPVYNAGGFLVEAIESILNQTYKNFEFIIVDDASTDSSFAILKTHAKKFKKITLLRNTKKLGISETVKRAIKASSGDFIARMDADDVALTDRLEKQVQYLLTNKKTVAVGGQCLLVDRRNAIIGRKTFPTRFEDVYRYIFRFIPVQQPTLMIAIKRLPKNFIFYQDGMNTAEEVELLFKLFQYGKVENLKDVVLRYRLHETNTSLANIKETFLLTLLARIKAVFKYGYKPDLLGVTITFAQALIVLILPRKITLLVYKLIRKMSVFNLPSLRFVKNSFTYALNSVK